ncbi:structure-specific endonuclease subunit SLX4 isoform X2 [Lepus europaeus]|uniref:structure-specific endonuclease subunit SLX4 isoform X2 n=1 Tax=Lepus europaeus TaxID=9983 RepID=UPI002B4820B3|nr:structure-specific endonuclease subunit SLX4 isoform X2 [Lepus europaeus]
MDESDDDFKELCANFLQRVKKNGTKQVSGEKKTQKASNGTQIRSKLKKSKQNATKAEPLQGPAEKRPPPGSPSPRAEKTKKTKSQASDLAGTVNGEACVLAPAEHQPGLGERAQGTQTESVPNGDSQPPPPCLTTAAPNPSKPRTAELVLQRMQQFKRADPERLKHEPEERPPGAAAEGSVPKSPREQTAAGNGCEPVRSATDSDAAVALALQHEVGQEAASARGDDLEEKGLFFCQLCQKNLSMMSVARREQHVNRCLDEAEKALRPPAPQIPECPICGKAFLTSKSRASHLKQCAARMEVGPQLLLQAVRLQTAQPEGGGHPPTPSFSNPTGGVKRKRTLNKKEPRKRRKADLPEAPSEDLLVAMALSRSEMEQSPATPALRLQSAFSERREKKGRKRKPPVSPPQLLVQDRVTTGRQIEDRVALLLSEEAPLSRTPPLPASRILKEKLRKAGWCLQPPEGKQNFLWEGSALTGAWAADAFYTASLVPPIVPQRPAEGLTQEPPQPLRPPEQPESGLEGPPALPSSPGGLSPSASQREHQALQDLVDLAREGLSASPRPSSGDLASSGGATGLDVVPRGLPLTGFVLPKEKHLECGDHASLSFGLLVADFSAMVNNPHLSDVQFQVDSGELLYAHKFVLYARCPLLIQYVNNEGFCAVEDGDRSQRVLLSDVSAEAVRAFLQYLYTADSSLPPRLAPDLRALALRFGVTDLMQLCQQASAGVDVEEECQAEKEGGSCESRLESFQELLRSVWVDEDEEAEALSKSEGQEEDREKVNETEMEEIYEFAATQRRLLQGERVPDVDADQLPEDGPGPGQGLASIPGNEELEKAEQMELSGPGGATASPRRENVRPRVLPPQGQRSAVDSEARTQEQEAPEETGGHSSSPTPSGARGEGSLHSVRVHSEEQLPAPPQGALLQPSQAASDHEERGSTIQGREGELSHPPTPQQAPQPHLSCPPPQPPAVGSPGHSQLHAHHTGPLSGLAHSRLSEAASPHSPSPRARSRQKRPSSVLTALTDPGLQRGSACSPRLEPRTTGAPAAPDTSASIDLTQSEPERSSCRSPNPPSRSEGDEIILLSDSDEELEPEQAKIRPAPDAPGERELSGISPRSSELFSVIDVDADLECSQSPPRRGTGLQQGEEVLSENRGSGRSRGPPWLSCDHESSPEDSTTDSSSWLVPATPLASRSHDCSSQTQILSLRPRTPAAEKTGRTPRASENRGAKGAAQELSVIVPQMPPASRAPVTPGASASGRRGCRSPPRPQPRRPKHSSPLAPRAIPRGPPDFTWQFPECSPLKPGRPPAAAASEVVEVEDSEGEQEATSLPANSSPLPDSDPPGPADGCCWHAEPLSPIPIDDLNLERTGPLGTSSPSSRTQKSPDSGATPTRGRKSPEPSSQAGSPGSGRLSFLNSALWDDWDGGEKSPEAPPTAQTPGADGAESSGASATPGAHRKKKLPPKVPITPMPRYSIMETPVLKKELDRFGVRPLPKRQMVLKLKEIFQYTHQTLESDSEDEIPPSQAPREAPCSQTYNAETSEPSRAGGCTQLEAAPGPQHGTQQPSGGLPAPGRPPAPEASPGPDGDARLPASQESVATSVDSSDSSFSSQSSSTEFGAAFESAGEEEDGVSASQAAVPAGDVEEAVRRYIRSTPALYQKVLLYQPLELAKLQAALRQNGIRVAAGKLLDFLDTHCVTFTTAAARKEKLEGKRRRGAGRKKGGQK